MRPGIVRLNSSAAAMNAACGPPQPIGMPKRWLLPTAIWAPSSPGGFEQRQREEVGSDDDGRAALRATLDDAPCSRRSRLSCAGTGAARRMRPSRCTSASSSTTRTSIPSGAARVRTTAIVCGWHACETTNA